jgi:Protein of unknown function (DUF3102)
VNNLVPSQPQRDLAALAVKVRAGLDGAAQAGATMLAHLIDVGEVLIAAKKQAGPGKWLQWLKRGCDLSEDRAERLMRLARGKSHLDSARVRNLSLAGALRLIKQAEPAREPKQRQLPPPTASSTPSDKTPKTARFDAHGWWTSAFVEERRHFVDSIGQRDWEAAIPPSWRRDDIGAASSDEMARMTARIEELERELRQRDLTIAGLRRQLGEPVDDGLEIPPFLQRTPTPAAGRSNGHAEEAKQHVLQAPFSLPRDWRQLPAAELENLILAVRRSAVHTPLTEKQWRLVDRMRKRVAELSPRNCS